MLKLVTGNASGNGGCPIRNATAARRTAGCGIFCSHRWGKEADRYDGLRGRSWTAIWKQIEELIREQAVCPAAGSASPHGACRHRSCCWRSPAESRCALLYRLLPKELAAEVFVELDVRQPGRCSINGFSNTELKEVLDELYLDDAVDIVEEMPASVVDPYPGQGHAGHAQVHQRDTSVPGGLRRLHHEHGVPVPEEGHDGGGRLQAHPPHRRRAGDHQHPVRHRSHPPPAGRAVRPRPAAGGRGRPHRGHHGSRRGLRPRPWTTRRTWPRR